MKYSQPHTHTFQANKIETSRLTLSTLVPKDYEFILELVNTSGWLQYIGDRKIKDYDDAKAYIKRIIENPNIVYWVANLKETAIPIGIVTFIKRDYLDFHDIGFAFLPRYTKLGYAREATNSVIKILLTALKLTEILATTKTDNVDSINLLNRLNFKFDKELQVDNQNLQIYRLSFKESA